MNHIISRSLHVESSMELDSIEVEKSRIILGAEIGRGEFGTVHKV
jgi:hypothetical protein